MIRFVPRFFYVRPARGRVSRTERVSRTTANLEEAEGKAPA